MADYPFPVNKLLTIGDPREVEDFAEQWPDYQELGLGKEDIPELIRMATDRALRDWQAEGPEAWAPLHAWRALGQFKAAEAVEPLLKTLPLADELDDDWALEEIPEALALIGEEAIPAVAAFLADPANGLYPRASAARALELIAQKHPSARDQCVSLLTRQLEAYEQQDYELNAFLIDHLMRLQADESGPVIERAFEAGRVDESVVGTWEEVAYELGLREEPPPGRRWSDFGPAIERPPRDHKAKAKAKAKRKQAAKARKRNRKRR